MFVPHVIPSHRQLSHLIHNLISVSHLVLIKLAPMPESPAKRAIWNDLRRRMYRALKLPPGLTDPKNPVEIRVRGCSRAVMRKLSPDEVQRWDLCVPAWLTEEVLVAAYNQEDSLLEAHGQALDQEAAPPEPVPGPPGLPAPPAEPVPAPPGPVDSSRIRARALDIYLTEHREALKQEVLTQGCMSTTKLRNTWRHLGVQRFNALCAADRLNYIAQVRSGAHGPATRKRDARGMFKHVPVPVAAPPEDQVLLADVAREVAKDHNHETVLQVPKAALGERTLAKFAKSFLLSVQQTGAKGASGLKEPVIDHIAAAVAHSGIKPKVVKRWFKGRKLLTIARKQKVHHSKPGGRPKGWAMPDAELITALQSNTNESARWSMRHQTPVRTLKGSKKDIWRQAPSIRSRMSYRAFCHQLQGGRLPVAPATGRTDLCDYCHQFDQDRKTITAIVQECKNRASHLWPSYWVKWEQFVQQHAAFHKPGFLWQGSPEYLRGFCNYMLQWVPDVPSLLHLFWRA